MDYSRFINSVSKAREPSAIRLATEILSKNAESLISMASGNPNPQLFPFKDVTYKLADGTNLTLGAKETQRAMQYSATPGIAELLDWLITLQKHMHQPPTSDFVSTSDSRMTLCVTTGSQDAICKALECLVSDDDNVLVESPIYAATLAILRPLGATLLPVQSDIDGLQPQSLVNTLSRWKSYDTTDPDCTIPKLLYCVPNGGNPTGHVLTFERKKQIYEIAQKYNFLILEDDPYYSLQFNKPLVPSFLSMDTDGRVLRFDSFSKLVSSGMRLGYVTGPQALVEQIALHMQVSVCHANSLGQISLLALLNQWGLDGFVSHAEQVADFYKQRCDQCLLAADRHLRGIAEWEKPGGGMFLWIKLLGIPDTHELIMEKALDAGVLFVPGSAFSLDTTQPSPYVRVSFSIATDEQMNEGFKRLAKLVKQERQEI